MYADTKKVLEDIRIHFGKIYSEPFIMSRSPCDKFATFKSENYLFEVMAGFIQARVESDFFTPIEKRIEDVIKNEEIKPSKGYIFTSKNSDGPIPIEYCLTEI